MELEPISETTLPTILDESLSDGTIILPDTGITTPHITTPYNPSPDLTISVNVRSPVSSTSETTPTGMLSSTSETTIVSISGSVSSETVASFSSNFGSCSYLSPFSTSASLIVMGGDECADDIDFIKPKNTGSNTLQCPIDGPTIAVVPPTPRLNRQQEVPVSPVKAKPTTGQTVASLLEKFTALSVLPMVKVPSLRSPPTEETDAEHEPDARDAALRRTKSNEMPRRPPNSFGHRDKGDTFDILQGRHSVADPQVVVHEAGIYRSDSFIKKRMSLDVGALPNSRKISLDHHGSRWKKVDLSIKKRSYSVVSNVTTVSEGGESDDGDKKETSIWKQFRGAKSNIFKVKVASVFNTLKEKKKRSSVTNKIYDAESGPEPKSSGKLLRYEFEKDQVYLGEVHENKAHGHGVLHFKGCQYGGRWENGMEVIGCYLWPSGVQYHGTWEGGYRHGSGVEKHATYMYKGEWVKDTKQGYGVASSQSGCLYEGTWHNGQHEGYGVEVYKDGGFYAGQFNHGIRDGHGVRVFNPTGKLKETFTNNTVTDTSAEVPSAMDLERLLGSEIFEPVGEGDKTEIYRGQWKEDKRHGPGIERNAEGDVFEGNFKDNMRDGYGVLKSNNGHVFYGRWKKSKLIKNKRTVTNTSHKAALRAQDGCSIAERKTWLALSRAHGARRFAYWAVHSQREAYKHYALSEEKEKEARALVDIGNVGANIVAQNALKEWSPSIARRGLSKLSNLISPLPSRRSVSSLSDIDDSPLSNRKSSTASRFLNPHRNSYTVQ